MDTGPLCNVTHNDKLTENYHPSPFFQLSLVSIPQLYSWFSLTASSSLFSSAVGSFFSAKKALKTNIVEHLARYFPQEFVETKTEVNEREYRMQIIWVAGNVTPNEC